MAQGEVYIAIGQCHPAQLLCYVSHFRIGASQEFPSCRHVEEQITHCYCCTHRCRCGFDFALFPAVHTYFVSALPLGPAADYASPANTGNAGQRFPSEPHRSDSEQVFIVIQFTGSMLGEGQTDIFFAHAHPVVRHLD